ncbi:glycosyltransferase family 4 protein [Chryseobacterium sp. FH1]|uniref:glycosyltransferase family 4 protein n=1 Tax=Chryseobacterium sp. FH1 TaxID=1233951 RepID=UPI0004E329CC|nr:glycosyltransferase family 4 protein [Chryseobacterium sp. FH1]KFC24575.1 glycosyl transferase family 1 [Chryseobacterium sp. FH1]
MKKLFRIATVPMSLNILLKGQLKFLNQYYDLTAISGSGADLDEVREREGVKVHPIEIQRQISPVKDLISLIKLYIYFRKEKPDIIHSITPKAGLLSMIAGKLAGVPVRIHTFTGLVFPYKEGVLQKILILMDKILCRCATNIFPEGQGVKSDLENFKITDKPLTIIGNGNVNGIDLGHFDPALFSEETKTQLRKDLNIAEDDFVFIFVGRLVRDKGINELISAFQTLQLSNPPALQPTNSPNLKLLLVGPLEQDLDPLSQDVLNEIETNPDIVSVGFQKDVRPYFAISNALVFPSYREGFPNVVLQALAMGIPALVSDINGCNEIIQNQHNGLIFPSKNKEKLLEAMSLGIKKDIHTRLQSQSRSSIMIYKQELIWELLKEKYTELLESV